MKDKGETNTQNAESGNVQFDTENRRLLAFGHAPEIQRESKTGDPNDKPNYEGYVFGLIACAAILLMFWKNSRLFLDTHAGSISALATVAIVFLTFVYVVYAKSQWKVMDRQLNQMKDQATLMERQLTMQEIAQQQWVQLTGWRIEQRSPAQGNPIGFTVAMEIENPTSIPLTVEAVTAKVAGRQFSFSANNLIGPEDNIKVEFPINLADDEKTRCANYRLIFPIDGSVAYMEGIGTQKRRQQPFCLSCRCGPNNFEEFSHIHDTRGKPDDKKEN